MLRPYQAKAIQDLYNWFREHTGHPCLVLPTGSGKSHIVAELCKDAVQNWPETRILMLTHVKELIEQNARKLLLHWPEAPLGIYSAGIGRKELGRPITFAGIQSVHRRANQLGKQDLVIIDECFTADTVITTQNGEKRISEIMCGEKVFHALGIGTVEAVSKRKVEELFTLEFDDGTITQCTGNHKFFTDRGWQEAKTLEIGSCFFSKEGVRLLQEDIHTLDKEIRGRNNHINITRKGLDQAAVLFDILLEEAGESNEQSQVQNENESPVEGNKAQADQTRRKWAPTSLGSTGHSPCPGRRMGGGSFRTNKNEAFEHWISYTLQNRYSQQNPENRHRAGRPITLFSGETEAGQEENRVSYFPRLVNISRNQQESTAVVFNLQVSGHPSYFADGKLVHNCHLVNHYSEGIYRTLIRQLEAINPNLRVIGLTATPYRLGHGMITDKPAVFDDLITPVSIEQLVGEGYLAPLRSKATRTRLSVDGVHKRGGEYIEKELQKAVDVHEKSEAVVKEVISLAGDRKSWLFFCTGVDHARHVRDILNEQGIPAKTVTGNTPKKVREEIIESFKSGETRALTNANVLTTGFDYPDIDLIVMMRPTLSPGLYCQMAGRGFRLKSHTDHCLILDFAGVVEAHGPITAVRIPSGKKESSQEQLPPSKICSNCDEIVAAQVRICPLCGYEFPREMKRDWHLRNDDIMGREASTMEVSGWYWSEHISQKSGKEMLKVMYSGGLMDRPITEYLCIFHDGYAGRKALGTLRTIAASCGVALTDYRTTDDLCRALQRSRPPSEISYRKEGKFFRILDRTWNTQPAIMKEDNDECTEQAYCM